MTTQTSPTRKQRTLELGAPKATGDILRAVDALEDQLEHLLGPRPNPPHPIIRNVNTVVAEQMSVGDRVADAVAITTGSWRFIGIQSALLTMWVTLNVMGWVNHWHPYPFILLNLALSFQAAYSAPLIMMSQNRRRRKAGLWLKRTSGQSCGGRRDPGYHRPPGTTG